MEIRFDIGETKIGGREDWTAGDSGERPWSTYAWLKPEQKRSSSRDRRKRFQKIERLFSSRRKLSVSSLSFVLRFMHAIPRICGTQVAYRDHFCLLCDKKCDRRETLSSYMSTTDYAIIFAASNKWNSSFQLIPRCVLDKPKTRDESTIISIEQT